MASSSHISLDATSVSAISAADTEIKIQSRLLINSGGGTQEEQNQQHQHPTKTNTNANDISFETEEEISTVTSTPSCDDGNMMSMDSPERMNHNTNNATDDNPNENNSDRDWSLPVSKFLEGFRTQAATSLSNAYR